MVQHTDFFIVYNEVIVDVNISPPFPEYNETGLFQIQRQLIIMDVITYPCWDLSDFMLVKGPQIS